MPRHLRPTAALVRTMEQLAAAVSGDPTLQSPGMGKLLDQAVGEIFDSMTEWDVIMTELHQFDDVDVAVAAVFKLDEAADESWLPRLHHLLAHGENFFVREAAAEPIARLEGIRALPQLLHALELGSKEGHDNDGLGSIVTNLVYSHPQETAAQLLEMIGDPADRRRSQAAWLWGYVHEYVSLEPLLELARDPNARVRSAAVGSLSSFNERADVVPALLKALTDDDEQVRVKAASGLGYLGDQRAVPELHRALHDPAERVRLFAGIGLEKLSNPKD
jgi:HEAT repeat protein